MRVMIRLPGKAGSSRSGKSDGLDAWGVIQAVLLALEVARSWWITALQFHAACRPVRDQLSLSAYTAGLPPSDIAGRGKDG
jgi:hypothetical protein